MLTIGASDEQLDVFNEVWYVMLLNTGQAIEAIEVIGKRIKMMEGAPFMWRLLERGYANGREAGSYCWRAFIAATMDERRNASFRILDECSTSPHVESHVHSFGRNIGLIDLRFVVILFGCLKSYFRD